MDEKEEDKKVEEAKVVESAQEDEIEPTEVQEVVYVVTTAKLITKVVIAKTVTTASAIIPTVETQVPSATPTATPARVVTAPSRRRKGVVIRDPEEESTTSTSTIIPETKSKDKGKGILVEEPKPLKKKQQIEMDEGYARKLHAELNKDIDWDVAIDHVKLKAKEDPTVKRYQAIKRKPQTKAQARKNMMMYLKNILILLVERRYPLSRFTLDQMLNVVRLQVEEESEGKLNPRYIRPFKILAKVGTVAYHLELLDQLSQVHSTIHVLNLMKCLSDKTLAIPLDEIQVDDKLYFIKEHVEIMDREVKRLNQSRILIVKVRWNSRRCPEFTWERKYQMQKMYRHLFANSTPVANVTS
nr:putative reverse transcriptase domain-containing protein [Tanacetum cinerariifolium]